MTTERSKRLRALVAHRLSQVRFEKYGPTGAQLLAMALGLPLHTWLNYEAGVTIPGEILLRFLEISAVEARWLLTGEGPMYRSGDALASNRGSVRAFRQTLSRGISLPYNAERGRQSTVADASSAGRLQGRTETGSQ